MTDPSEAEIASGISDVAAGYQWPNGEAAESAFDDIERHVSAEGEPEADDEYPASEGWRSLVESASAYLRDDGRGGDNVNSAADERAVELIEMLRDQLDADPHNRAEPWRTIFAG